MRRATFFVLFIFSLLSVGTEVHAAPKSVLWEKWSAHNPVSKMQVDHGAWDAFLKTYVKTSPGRYNAVDYAGVTSQDRKALGDYIDTLTQTPVSKLNRAQQKAYWINLYNALTVKVVLDHYPVESIRDIDISPGLFSNGPWGKALVEIESEPISLNDIEHRILRPIWNDSRVHYAVNCASVGCPNLATKAFSAGNIEALLDASAVDYINSPRGVRIEGADIIVSSIYDWFQEDFGGNEKGVIAHLLKYAMDPRKKILEQAKGISDYEYDWSLNGL